MSRLRPKRDGEQVQFPTSSAKKHKKQRHLTKRKSGTCSELPYNRQNRALRARNRLPLRSVAENPKRPETRRRLPPNTCHYFESDECVSVLPSLDDKIPVQTPNEASKIRAKPT